MEVITLALPEETLQKLEKMAKEGPLPSDRSKIIRAAIDEFLRTRGVQ